jgi:hypothetical protein
VLRPAIALLLLACTPAPTAVDVAPMPAPDASSVALAPTVNDASPATVSPVDAAAPVVDNAHARPATCVRAFVDDATLRRAPEGEPISIADLFARAPSAGRFTVEGFVQLPHHCPTCPKGVFCKPCEDSIWLSESRGAFKHPLSPDVDLLVSVPDATPFELLHRARLTIELCERRQPRARLPDLELRGYRLLP